MSEFYKSISIVVSPAEDSHIRSTSAIDPRTNFPLAAAKQIRGALVNAVAGKPLPPVAAITREGLRRQIVVRLEADLFDKVKLLAKAWGCSFPNAIRRCLGLPAVMQGAPSSHIRVANPDLVAPTGVPPHLRKLDMSKPAKKGARR